MQHWCSTIGPAICYLVVNLVVYVVYVVCTYVYVVVVVNGVVVLQQIVVC